MEGLLLLIAPWCTVAADDGNELLAAAAKRQDWEAVGSALERGGSPVDGVQSDGMTALLWAIYHDDFKTAGRLLEAGADAAVKNRYGVTPLALACQNGNARIVEALLGAGADANGKLRGGESALMTAARTGRTRPVDALISHGAKIDAKDRKGQTALMWAAADGHADVVELLIKEGAGVHTRLKSGFNAMFFAAREGRSDVVDVLLAEGVDVSSTIDNKGASGRLPRHGTSALLIAVENGHFELATRLLEAGADPDDQRSGYAPLHVLTWVRKPNRGDGIDGLPPPGGSGEMTSLAFVKVLAGHGADVNLRLKRGPSGGGQLGKKGATPFLLASKTGDLPMLKLLDELGADPLVANADGSTPLMAAAGVGTRAPTEEAGTEPEALAAVSYILGLGGELDTVDKNGETAMHGAAYKSLPKMVHLLAEKGADIEVWNQKNKKGWTPLLIAQGFRPGNFKPAPDTVDALSEVMRAAGVDPPPPPPRPAVGKRKEYP